MYISYVLENPRKMILACYLLLMRLIKRIGGMETLGFLGDSAYGFLMTQESGYL
jgi:hypothetical protein